MLNKIFAALMFILMLASTVLAGGEPVHDVESLSLPPSAETGALRDETPQLYFVELASQPAVEGGSAGRLKADQGAFRLAAQQAGARFSERYTFETLFNGFSIAIQPADLARLSAVPGVKGIYPIDVIALPPVSEADNPDLYTALAMTGAAATQSELGYTGRGIRVAVMDTGLDYDHPAFGGDGAQRGNSAAFPTSRVLKGWDFVGDAFNADPSSAAYNPVPRPDPFPDDCNGHGTHVAGIIGANDPAKGLKGAAPEVSFGAYRVFGCEGSTTSDIMLMAMEQAYKDGMQVLNMSIGSAYQWPQYPTAAAASRLVSKGLVVVASIGNSGASGLYSAGAPGLGEGVIGVASVDNTHVYTPYFESNGRKIGYLTMTYSTAAPLAGSAEMVNVDLACSPLLAGSLAGKVALAARGTCAFGVKAANAIEAGASAVVISNNAPGIFNGTLGAPLANEKPVVGISQADGAYLRAQAAPLAMTWTDQQDTFPSPTGGLISSFSSYGLSPDLNLKPDLSAPGGNIFSTYPLEKGGYASMGGTSMASPHAAGAAALFLQAHPEVKAKDVRTFLQNSADPRPWGGNPTLGLLEPVNHQGAGLIQVDKAILAAVKVEPPALALGESQAGPAERTLKITNNGKTAVSFSLTAVQALSVRGTYSPVFSTSNAVVTFDPPIIMAPAGKTAAVKVTITPPTTPDKAQYGGYLVLNGSDSSVLRVPFAGLVGDYQSIQALTPTSYQFPWLARAAAGSYQKINGPQDWTFTMENGDMPYLLLHFDHQVQQLVVEILDAATEQPIHPAFSRALYEEYLPRSSTSTSFFAFAWDGTRIHSNGYNGNGYTRDLTKVVPDGQYILRVKALKALGDPANSAHWETWSSPVIVLDRP